MEQAAWLLSLRVRVTSLSADGDQRMSVRSERTSMGSGGAARCRRDIADAWLDNSITRRAFLARAAALGVSVSVAGAVLAACEQATSRARSPAFPGSSAHVPSPFVTPAASADGIDPIVIPVPAKAIYGPMLNATELIAADVPSTITALLAELATERHIPMGIGVTPGPRQARVNVTIDGASLPVQAYQLGIADAQDGPTVIVRAGDEAGAFYGLLSLAQLVVTQGSTMRLRTTTIDDAPGFVRRGAILDPAPQTGVTTPASRTELLDRVRLGVQYKLNFVDLPGRTPWPELVRYCDDHFVEVMVGWGYRDALTTTPRQQVKDGLAAQLDAGARSIALNWDDIRIVDPESMARRHADVFLDLYAFLRARDPGVRVSAVLPPYGGVPGRQLVGAAAGDGERYLAVMKTALPDDVRVFWTGDGGIFSTTVTATAAKAYADAVGHELGLWDNDAIDFSRERRPLSGRATDLATVVSTYMGNLAGEANWKGTNGEFAMLTALSYAWNPATYDPESAAAAAERILAARSR